MHSRISDVHAQGTLGEVNPQEIIYLLKKMNISQSLLAKQLSVAPSVVNNVIHGRSTSYFVASYIAKILGKSLPELWPERYKFKPRGACKSAHLSQEKRRENG